MPNSLYTRIISVMLIPPLMAVFGCRSDDPPGDPDVEVYEVERVDYSPPPIRHDDEFRDDRLQDKKTAFDPELVDRRPLDGWLVNQSEAVIRLNIPAAKPDIDRELLVLRASFADSLTAAQEHRRWVPALPSVNLLDGKAKQFDDGLYAAIDLACFRGIPGGRPGHLDLAESLLSKVDANGPAAAYLAAGLTLGGRETRAADGARRDALIAQFRANPAVSKPIGFYTWNTELEQCWAFLRFFQQPLDEGDPIVADLLKAFEADAALAAECKEAADFYGKLTNPLQRLTIGDLVGTDIASQAALATLRRNKGVKQRGVSLFPPSSSREVELFERLFPTGVPRDADLMSELVRRIRSGEVDLSPRENSGWYDYQVYALETMLLPERGDEHNKLLLTKPYKKRMLEAFQALITKRRETHVRQLAGAKAAEARMPDPPKEIVPRLRIEPCPSFYLRTARSYSFLRDFLTASLGEEMLRSLHGLRRRGEQAPDLAAELDLQRDLFFGLHLVSCEDIGLAPTLSEPEASEMERYYDAALAWLENVADEPDLAEDTRVAVPIYVDPFTGTSRLWVTLGVRLAQLDAKFETSPRIKPANGEGDWQTGDFTLGNAPFLISVDEFAEVEVPTLTPPNRDELRKLCDAHKTKEAMIEALSTGKW